MADENTDEAGDLQPLLLVESALFSAGKPLTLEEIAAVTGLEDAMVGLYLKKLAQSYSRRETSVEIIKAGRKYAMRLKEAYVPKVSSLAAPEIPQKLIRTAALIAYHQPMKQSELVDMYGAKVYDHVKELVKLGLVLSRKDRGTKVLTTTQRFAEVFGIGSVSKKKVKGFVKDRAIEKIIRLSGMSLESFDQSSEKGEDASDPHIEGDEKEEGGQ
ncbi:MAG: SMC-Scp complex subunit ScpB [Candidatus Thermoplasmatota archaeon]|nr:SMC-Scp complex subunit ScpB [Candidatus Thermoplasmatota archaeon]